MSHFYGWLYNNQNNDKTLRGHKTTGISSKLQSWRTAIHTNLNHMQTSENHELDLIDFTIYDKNTGIKLFQLSAIHNKTTNKFTVKT